jgi:4-diphosphocytidyl-2C-methyl-D-erythritol kinase
LNFAAVDAMMSGTSSTVLRLPSRSKSTANFLNAVGMNCVAPKAPAHEPRICCGVRSP